MRMGHPRVRDVKGIVEFVLASENERGGLPAVVFTQHDVRELQLGKAAIRAGVATLLSSIHLVESQVDEVIIAGAFGKLRPMSPALLIWVCSRRYLWNGFTRLATLPAWEQKGL